MIIEITSQKKNYNTIKIVCNLASTNKYLNNDSIDNLLYSIYNKSIIHSIQCIIPLIHNIDDYESWGIRFEYFVFLIFELSKYYDNNLLDVIIKSKPLFTDYIYIYYYIKRLIIEYILY